MSVPQTRASGSFRDTQHLKTGSRSCHAQIRFHPQFLWISGCLSTFSGNTMPFWSGSCLSSLRDVLCTEFYLHTAWVLPGCDDRNDSARPRERLRSLHDPLCAPIVPGSSQFPADVGAACICSDQAPRPGRSRYGDRLFRRRLPLIWHRSCRKRAGLLSVYVRPPNHLISHVCMLRQYLNVW